MSGLLFPYIYIYIYMCVCVCVCVCVYKSMSLWLNLVVKFRRKMFNLVDKCLFVN